ncbi:PspC domain-containing protein [Lacimicrobium sp. SS2-24]|uniref:PspC domain-containing protein n=1 Tax=Lacimicrobium sp. SS2-24 TaxID=2005569 RepID=UPI000B4B7626|nr:PspC domain-containing protein [Lacimicrobium sp. SS2-24]
MKTIYQDRRIRKNRARGKVAGVCAGIAQHFDVPAWLIRLVAILCFISFPVAVAMAYLVAAFILPDAL